MKFCATSEKGRRGKKAGYGRTKGKGKVVTPLVCPLTLLPREIWERIAAWVTCKVFLDAARSPPAYKVASIAEIPVVFGYDMEDRPEDVILFKSERAGNRPLYSG
ncbi:hypothetical protein Ahy_A01g001644 isoform B [Arachis hypogaea]|uniref:Uncharacterized protein n=1 Tax=Arachis hypogaea TaxID=3818 RepID=A0A445ENY1_ARAHY|nr:hypothetical protein Ahy_A01g001644 isoform B [Arachis hypogaea]